MKVPASRDAVRNPVNRMKVQMQCEPVDVVETQCFGFFPSEKKRHYVCNDTQGKTYMLKLINIFKGAGKTETKPEVPVAPSVEAKPEPLLGPQSVPNPSGTESQKARP